MALKDLFGDDIFISYSRRDGTVYASKLAASLTSRGYSCFLDRASAPGTDLISATSKAVRSSRAMVVVASPMTADSEIVDAEIRSFLRARRSPTPLVVIGFDVSIDTLRFAQLVDQRIIYKEETNTLKTGVPTDDVVQHIINTLEFSSQRKRLKQSIWSVFALYVALLIASVLALVRYASNGPTGHNTASLIFGTLSLGFLIGGSSIAVLLQRMKALLNQSAEVRRVAAQTEEAGAAAFLTPFISYSHADKPFALRLEAALRKRGVTCWLDEKKLRPGDDLYEEIAKAIEDFDKFLLCCSAHSLRSWWVDNELANAFQKEEAVSKKQGRPIRIVIPLNLDGALFGDGWSSGYKAQLLRRLAVDFTECRSEKKFQENVERVMTALET